MFILKKGKIIGILIIGIAIIIPALSFTIESISEIEEKKEINNKIIANKDYYAILEIPKIKLKKEIYEINDKQNNVEKNILVHKTSIFPDVKNSNVILAGHSGNGKNAYFKNLYKLRTNDIVYLYYNNKLYKYIIREIEEQEKTGELYLKTSFEDRITLITCTYKNKNTQTIYYANLKSIENLP